MEPPVRALATGPGEHRKRRWTLPICILSIAIVELVFYSLVIGLFLTGLLLFDEQPNLHTDKLTSTILRSVIIGFAGVYFLLALILLVGVLKKVRVLLVIWMTGIVIFMVLEWICVVISVAILLNGALFFISGSYGPLRLYFVCLAGLYAQRLKLMRTATVFPLVKPSEHSDGYSMMHNAIFTQPLSDEMEEDEPIKVTFEIAADRSDQSLI